VITALQDHRNGIEANRRVIQMFLGHRSLRTTQHYTYVSNTTVRACSEPARVSGSEIYLSRDFEVVRDAVFLGLGVLEFAEPCPARPWSGFRGC